MHSLHSFFLLLNYEWWWAGWVHKVEPYRFGLLNKLLVYIGGEICCVADPLSCNFGAWRCGGRCSFNVSPNSGWRGGSVVDCLDEVLQVGGSIGACSCKAILDNVALDPTGLLLGQDDNAIGKGSIITCCLMSQWAPTALASNKGTHLGFPSHTPTETFLWQLLLLLSFLRLLHLPPYLLCPLDHMVKYICNIFLFHLLQLLKLSVWFSAIPFHSRLELVMWWAKGMSGCVWCQTTTFIYPKGINGLTFIVSGCCALNSKWLMYSMIAEFNTFLSHMCWPGILSASCQSWSSLCVLVVSGETVR